MKIASPEFCFWSLLSKEDFRFLYIPVSIGRIKLAPNGQSIKDTLLHRSLFDIMHPIEIELAKADLSRFLNLKVLAGSVTRCRLLSVENLAIYLASAPPTYQRAHSDNRMRALNWNIIDLVMYTVTENTVLAFFHNYDLKSCCLTDNVMCKPNCDQYQQCFIQEDTADLITALERQEKSEQKFDLLSAEEDIHIFQVIDRLTNEPIAIWPQPQKISSIDMIISKTYHVTLKEMKNSSFCSPHQLHDGSNVKEYISCSRHFYASSKVDIFETHSSNFHRILIPYGNIVFESLQISSVGPYSHINYHSCSSPSFSNGLATSIRPPHLSIMNISSRSKSIDYSDFTHSISRQLYDQKRRFDDASSQLSALEVEKNQVFNNNYGVESTMESPWSEHRKFNNGRSKSNQDDNSVGPSLFQKFRIQRYEEASTDVAQPSSTNYTSIDKRRSANFIYKQTERGALPKNIKICASCHTSNSPEWRRGPDGHKTLCNACGLRYSRFKSKQWIATTSKPGSKQWISTTSKSGSKQ